MPFHIIIIRPTDALLLNAITDECNINVNTGNIRNTEDAV